MIERLKYFLFLLIVCVLFSSFSVGYDNGVGLTIFLIGDSTMANKKGTPEENPERGWGQLLPDFFKETVEFQNHAVNGRSSKSFLNEGRWDEVLNKMKSGDYVFIQFGHNDQKVKDPNRYTNPWTGYRRNLERFVQESKEKGAYPILLSSIVRRNFNEQGTLVDTHGEYPFVASFVAEKMEVPFIDMQLLTEDFVNTLGLEKSKKIYLWLEPGQYEKFPNGKQDNTHLSLKGATQFAKLVADEIRKMEIPLSKFLI